MMMEDAESFDEQGNLEVIDDDYTKGSRWARPAPAANFSSSSNNLGMIRNDPPTTWELNMFIF